MPLASTESGCFVSHHGFHDLDGGEYAVACVGKAAENYMAGLLAADEVPVLAHVLCDVLVADSGLFIADAERIERPCKAPCWT